jgi:hypothetical protein
MDDLHLHVGCPSFMRRHHIQQCRRQRIEEPFANEHATEVVLSRRTLKVENAADAVQSMLDQRGLVGVVLIEEVN